MDKEFGDGYELRLDDVLDMDVDFEASDYKGRD